MRIVNVKKVTLGPTIKGFFDVDFDKFVIKGFKFMQQPGQNMWVSPPDEKYVDKDGATKYKKVVEITDKEYQKKIETAAIEAYNNTK